MLPIDLHACNDDKIRILSRHFDSRKPSKYYAKKSIESVSRRCPHRRVRKSSLPIPSVEHERVPCFTHGKAEPPSGEYHSVVLEESYACALSMDDKLECWGDSETLRNTNFEGNYIDFTIKQHEVCAYDTVCGTPECRIGADISPRPQLEISNFRHVNSRHHCAITKDENGDRDICWGHYAKNIYQEDLE